MKTIILAGYLAGIVYQLLCTDVIKYFGNANREVFEAVMEKQNPYNLDAKIVYKISSIIMFVAMIISILIWPVGLLWSLWIRIKAKYSFWKTMKMLKKIEKELEELLRKTDKVSSLYFCRKEGYFMAVEFVKDVNDRTIYIDWLVDLVNVMEDRDYSDLLVYVV